MVKLKNIFSQIRSVNILLVGDFLVDKDTKGKISRISPEAPVPIFHITHTEQRAGGAGNVALNLLALGARVVALGRRGRDVTGEILISILQKAGADVSPFIIQGHYPTPIKNRLLVGGQQILRIDTEEIVPLENDLQKQLEKRVAAYIDGMDVVVISDYGKGFLSDNLLYLIIQEAQKKHVPVIVDPKGDRFAKYRGASLIKPNLTEAYQAAKMPLSEPLENVAEKLLQETGADFLIITRSEEGISVFDRNGKHQNFPVISKEVKDVTGAGDTTLAIIAVAYANHLEISLTARLANIAAGLAIERLGCATVSFSDIAFSLLHLNVENKIFKGSSLFILKQILKGKKLALIAVEAKAGLGSVLFEKIRACKKNHYVMICLKESKPDRSFVRLLCSLEEIDFVVFLQNHLKDLCEQIHPHIVIDMQQDKPIIYEDPKSLFHSLCYRKAQL